MEQCSFTGGSLRCCAMIEFLISPASLRSLPLSHSVVNDELAIAEPHPKVCGVQRGAQTVSSGTQEGDAPAAGGAGVRAALRRRRALKTASSTFPSAPTFSCNFITSPQAGAPTRPVPTVGSFLSNDPTLRGDS